MRVVLEDKPPGGTAKRPVKLNPPGTKKLVPTLRSSNNKIPAESNTPKASSPRIAVMNQDQQVSGIRIRVMPLARRSRIVVMKFKAPINDAIDRKSTRL